MIRALTIVAIAAVYGVAIAGRAAPTESPYVPTPASVVDVMIRLADLRPGDVVYDLGCGDGRLVIAAAAVPGVRGVCVELDERLCGRARARAAAAGVAERVEVRCEDLFRADLRSATVVMLFLWPTMNGKVLAKLRAETRPGTRLLSHWHEVPGWTARSVVRISANGRERPVYAGVVH